MKLLSIPTLGLVAAGAITAACASTPPPTAQVASAESAVQSARGAGAESAPTANTHLTRAENQLRQAKGLINEGENEEAAALAQRAEADASLAVALSREAQQRAATDAAIERVRSMQQTQSETQMPSLEPSSP